MARKIVLLRKRRWLTQGFKVRSMDKSLHMMQSKFALPKGLTFEEEAYPVRIPVGRGVAVDRLGRYRGMSEDQYLVSVEVEDDAVAEEFNEKNPDVVGMFSDPEINVCPEVDLPNSRPLGRTADVKTGLHLKALHKAGGKGQGVKIVVVDTGIDGRLIPVSGGYSPRPGILPGRSSPNHGTMVAYDAKIAAPDAAILDYPLLRTAGRGWVAFLSDAIRAFSEIMVQRLQEPGPMVAVNSWALFSRAQDAKEGNPQNYSRNPVHPFNQITAALAGCGVDVVFAAGNCGGNCPDDQCGPGDSGPGNSIHGANSHPDAISVAAVTVKDQRLCYSSQGPGALNAQTPDISGFSHFRGSGVVPVDMGTSAACPVVAGVVAALRSTPEGRDLSTAGLKEYLIRNARKVEGTGWSPDYGWGIVDADATYKAIAQGELQAD